MPSNKIIILVFQIQVIPEEIKKFELLTSLINVPFQLNLKGKIGT